MESNRRNKERRAKCRFQLERELRFQMTGQGGAVIMGSGRTINLCSAGVLFASDHTLQVGEFVELSINWPVLLDDECPMRLVVFGRILRVQGRQSVCSIDKYEFRTARRNLPHLPGTRTDGMLQRWADGMRKGILKENAARA